MINWGIIGLGKIARRFSRSLAGFSDGKLYAVASHNAEKRKLFEEQFQPEKVYDDYQKLLDDENVDIVYIALPHKWHYRWIISCLKSHKNVLCEKPAVVYSWQVEEIFALAKEKGCFYMEAMKSRCIPLRNDIKRILKEGQLGEIRKMEVHFNMNAAFPPEHYMREKEYGGCFYDTGCYGVAAICDYLEGEVENVEVQCEKRDGVDVHTTATFRFDNGSRATTESSTIAEENVRFLLIEGSKGRLWADNYYRPQVIEVEGSQGNYRLEKPYGDDDFQFEIAHVHQCLKAGLISSPLMDYADSLRYVKLMEMVRKKIEEVQ